MSDFASRLAQAMIKQDYIKQRRSWFQDKTHDDITSELDQSRLAEETKIKPYTLNRHLKGRQSPHIDDLRTYAKALDVSADWLIGLSDQIQSPKEAENPMTNKAVISCKEQTNHDLYKVVQSLLETRGFEENTTYPHNIKTLFCLGLANKHGQSLDEVGFIIRMFYLDYLFFLLTISSPSSLRQSEFFRNNVRRNITILNYLFLLLPHELNDRIDPKLQSYVAKLLELEIRPHTRQSIEDLFCITNLAFFWLNNNQPFTMILALKNTGTQVVIDLVNNVIKEQQIALKPIKVSTTEKQEQLHEIRGQIRAIIQKRLTL
jgi:transcriptional regulator with XRE-family HTH domain